MKSWQKPFIYAGSVWQPVSFDNGWLVVKAKKLDEPEEGNSPAPIVKKARRAEADRNEWLWDQYANSEKTCEAIMREAKTKGWTINSNSHLLQCVDNHCADNEIPITRRNPTTT